MAKDKFHYQFKTALENQGWKVTHDPLRFRIGNIEVHIDLAAERLIAAEKDGEKIAVEIKTFGNPSFITALYEAVGKYVVYRNVLKMSEPDRVLYLAVPLKVFKLYFEEAVLEETMKNEQFKLIVYNQKTQTIAQWIN